MSNKLTESTSSLSRFLSLWLSRSLSPLLAFSLSLSVSGFLALSLPFWLSRSLSRSRCARPLTQPPTECEPSTSSENGARSPTLNSSRPKSCDSRPPSSTPLNPPPFPVVRVSRPSPVSPSSWTNSLAKRNPEEDEKVGPYAPRLPFSTLARLYPSPS